MSQKQSKKSNKDLVLEFTNFLKFKKGLSANTISAYESDITQFLEFTGENIINNDLIELFITSELNDKSDNSKIRKRVIKSFIPYLVKNHNIILRSTIAPRTTEFVKNYISQ